MDINSSNAVMRERARIREEVVKIPVLMHPLSVDSTSYIRRADVLKILSDDKESN